MDDALGEANSDGSPLQIVDPGPMIRTTRQPYTFFQTAHEIRFETRWKHRELSVDKLWMERARRSVLD
jgi:hypothetical protein